MDSQRESAIKSRREYFFVELRKKSNGTHFDRERKKRERNNGSLTESSLFEPEKLVLLFCCLEDFANGVKNDLPELLALLDKIKNGITHSNHPNFSYFILDLNTKGLLVKFFYLFEEWTNSLYRALSQNEHKRPIEEVLNHITWIISSIFQASPEVINIFFKEQYLRNLIHLITYEEPNLVANVFWALSNLVAENVEMFAIFTKFKILKIADETIENFYKKDEAFVDLITPAYIKFVSSLLNTEPVMTSEDTLKYIEVFIRIYISKHSVIKPVEVNLIGVIGSFFNQNSEEECQKVLESSRFQEFFHILVQSSKENKEVLEAAGFLIANITSFSSDECVEACNQLDLISIIRAGLKSDQPKLISDCCIAFSNIIFGGSYFIKDIFNDSELIPQVLYLINFKDGHVFSDALRVLRNIVGESNLPEIKSFFRSNEEIIDLIVGRMSLAKPADEICKIFAILSGIFDIGEELIKEDEEDSNIFTDRVLRDDRLINHIESLQDHCSLTVREYVRDFIEEYFEVHKI